jgi:hypothetical protein
VEREAVIVPGEYRTDVICIEQTAAAEPAQQQVADLPHDCDDLLWCECR